jgi:D-threonate/D-erythronate kinase
MQLPGLNIGIIADDLTGTNDTALPFFLAGCSTQVLLSLNALPPNDQAQVWAINTDSRHLPPAEAMAVVRHGVHLLKDRYAVDNIYKKVDSTLRGHVLLECLSALDTLGWDCAVLAPAFPQEDRCTVGGYQLLRGLPIEQTEVARDPLFPVRQSHIPTLLRQSIATHAGLLSGLSLFQPHSSNLSAKPSSVRPPSVDPIGHVELGIVLHGAGPILKSLSDQISAGKRLIVADACSATDLEQIALAIEKLRKTHRILPCGSAGLANAFTRLWSSDLEALVWSCPMQAGPILMVIGSNSQTTRLQMEELLIQYTHYGCHQGQQSDITVIELTPDCILESSQLITEDPETAPVEEATERLATIIANKVIQALGPIHNARNTVLLTSSLQPNAYAKTIAMAETLGLSPKKASQLTQRLMTLVVQQVLTQRPAKLVLSGGETATHLCRALGFQTLRLVAEAEASIPLAMVSQGPNPPSPEEDVQWIVTKSGNFGSPLTLANIVKALKQREGH